MTEQNSEVGRPSALDSSMTLNFACGCFLSIWAEDGPRLQSALACCESHERPHQTLSGILGTTKEMAFQDIYVPVVIPTLDEQFAALREKFPDATMACSDGRHNVVTFTVTPRHVERWNMSKIQIEFEVPIGFPFAVPECFWSDTMLRYANGSRPMKSGVQRKGPMGMWFWFKPHAWTPTKDTLLTYARMIQLALEGHYDR